MRDVARLAGVSVATVSTVINGKNGVSARLTRRVQQAVQALNYHPDHVARSLRVRQTHTIGMVMPQIASPFFAEVLRGAEDLAAQQGYSVLICNSRGDEGQEKSHLSTLISRRVDGILLASEDPHFAHHWFAPRRVPLVLFDRIPGGFKGTVVTTNNTLASYEATRHLISLGHQRIGVIAGPPDISTSDERLEGFRKAMSEASLLVREEYFKRGNYKLEGGYQCALELTKLALPPTALFSFNYEMTLGVMRALSEAGIGCPKQVSVLGFDDFVAGLDGFSWATMFSPKLTTVAQSSYELGRRAMQILLGKISPGDGEEDESEDGIVRLPAELRVRESTAPPPP
ncbi:MAG TPA: LacI family DNA-binding transcriptional regulator [Terriglobia bacterium]|nr:LacI family DNA-binding transcriptional regulator [Terriglobia bacterium]